MQIIKQKRKYWRVEPGSTAVPYATLELTSEYDTAGKWATGWHVFLRDPNGRITGHGGVYSTGNDAATAAVSLLSH